MIVNAYLVWDQVTKNTWIFDTGTETEPILNTLNSMELHVDAIFLTHTHRDHISCLEDLNEKLINKSTYVHKLELLDNCIPIDEGFDLKNGSLAVKALHTHGHSEGGITYVIDGLSRPLAIVGDAIFAGSIGGGIISYTDALVTNREKIMSLADETILCPGHGPISTVLEEKENNPFFNF